MKLTRTAIQIYQDGEPLARPSGMRAAVSLHSHSDCSREKLDFVPRIARGIPIVAALFERGIEKYRRLHGRDLDFSSAYWRPPLAPAAVIASEREQIECRFDCQALVSLTDHDTLEGPLALHQRGVSDTPLSVEWSVPFNGTVVHLGVHAIAPDRAAEASRVCASITTGAVHDVAGVLEWLGECPETFVVLNHPYWDLAGIGAMQHDSTLLAFLRSHRDRIHALEINGYRTWAENRRVLPLAEGFGLPVVGGGDRHGCTPNGIVNLTEATSLAEFARELRAGRSTYCVVFPEYTEPFAARVIETTIDALRHFPEHHRGRHRWLERVFMTVDGEEYSLASIWSAPWWLNTTVAATRLLGTPALHPLFQLTRADGYQTLAADCPGQIVAEAVPLAQSQAVV
jgi:hypothetical protein